VVTRNIVKSSTRKMTQEHISLARLSKTWRFIGEEVCDDDDEGVDGADGVCC
jgi:hypothetical protein